MIMNTKICLILSVSLILLLSSCKKANQPPEEEILINKWLYDLMDDDYHCFTILARAAMKDPPTLGLDSLIEKSSDNVLWQISYALKKKVKQIQTLPAFKDLPGRNPWGKTDEPVYRKSLPSEMKAMKKIVGYYAGDCSSISQLVLGLSRINGISEDDVFVLRSKPHSMILVQYKSETYIFNTFPEKISPIELLFLNFYNITGFYNDRYYGKKHVWLTRRGLSGEGTLKEKLESRFGVKFNDIKADYPQQNIEYLTRVALQEKSTDITGIINASVRGPLLKQKCSEIATLDEMVEWMNLNIDSKPLFSYDAFMTPDQVIVFKTAGNTDKALFLWCYCRNKNIPCELFRNGEACYLRAGNRLFLIDGKISGSDNTSDNAIPPGFMPLNML